MKYFFDDIIQELSEESKHARFNVNLADSQQSYNRKSQKNKNINSRFEQFIPESAISQQLFKSLNNIDMIDSQVSIVSNHIILAFRSIYHKYIDSYNATFMINISSRHRTQLRNLFDSDYYFQYCANSTDVNDSNDEKNNAPGRHRKRRTFDTWNQFLQSFSSRHKLNNNLNNKSFINDELKREIIKCYNNNNCNENMDQVKINDCVNDNNGEMKDRKIYKWLLSTMMKSMGPCAYEISYLMNDTFLRFRMNEKDLYQQLCVKIHNSKHET